MASQAFLGGRPEFFGLVGVSLGFAELLALRAGDL